MTNKNKALPELLSPAGSMQALKAAIEGGADAIYLGSSAFNARMKAKNFDEDELREAILLAHDYGVKIYIAANTLILDREIDEYIKTAESVYLLGADAMIIADVGAAAEVKKRIPIELHASTQLSGHNVEAAKKLYEAGFSRMVLAREMPSCDIREFCKSSPIESEVFVHGALCVCHSGQCLFSSIVGGRSGNRGECAQPCRLPYGKKGGYPLSLKDLSLAGHITELCDMGVSSFKIEGRMKSPEYVRDVTSVFRKLLDEGRNADRYEIEYLAKIFSRGGHTDAYFTKKIGSDMLGIRSDDDKKESAGLKPFENITKKIPLELSAEIRRGHQAKLCATAKGVSVTVEGAVPMDAINAPIDDAAVRKNLSKLGGSVYSLKKLDVALDEGLMLPVSSLNALRRSAIDALRAKNNRSADDFVTAELSKPQKNRKKMRTALFYQPQNIPKDALDFFNYIYVPLELYEKRSVDGIGVMLPEVIFDSERDKVKKMLISAYNNGARDALVGNIGHIELARECGFAIHGDIRLNVFNSSSMAELEKEGLCDCVLSPELTLRQIRDIGGNSAVTVYGRLPLMILEKCVGKEIGGCKACDEGRTELTDRKGVSFPVIRRFEHRSLILNSVPIYAADKREDLKRAEITAEHFIFSVESEREISTVIDAYRKGKGLQTVCRRLK